MRIAVVVSLGGLITGLGAINAGVLIAQGQALGAVVVALLSLVGWCWLLDGVRP